MTPARPSHLALVRRSPNPRHSKTLLPLITRAIRQTSRDGCFREGRNQPVNTTASVCRFMLGSSISGKPLPRARLAVVFADRLVDNR